MLASWISQEREARIIVTANASLVWASAAAQTLLEVGIPFCREDGHITTARRSVAHYLAPFLASASQGPQCWLLDEGGVWVIWAQQIESESDTCIGVTIRGGSQPIEFAALAEAGHLTPAEARVIAQMLKGADAAQIALELQISVETLRTHVKHAYRKLGVSSRGELFVGALPFLRP